MAKLIITKPDGNGEAPEARLKKLFWFVALWCGGVAGAVLLALPFKLLIMIGTG
jgi:hypothetical protein